MFDKILIANRGEIACRIIRTAKRLGVPTTAVYSEVDCNALHVSQADEAVYIGSAKAVDSYLRIDRIIEAALQSGAQAIHPGYGFLSENADFAEACTQNNIVFIGPAAQTIRDMGSKSRSKAIMQAAGVPLIPGYHDDNQQEDHLRQQAEQIRFPILIKASAGGGGKGMRLVEKADDFAAALAAAKREALNAFADDKILIEKYLTAPKHIEVQVLGDTLGNVVHLLERDCSVQRRYQKVIEEAPAPQLAEHLRQEICNTAVRAAKAVNYIGAGTVEFIVQDDQFYFMEMNTRLQVEHPVTEMITGIDLVESQLNISCGRPVEDKPMNANGHAIEARVYAEKPSRGFLPSTGTIEHLTFTETKNVRIDSGLQQGDEITIHYDPMLAKVVVWGETRDKALNKLSSALKQTQIAGLDTNVSFLHDVLHHRSIQRGDYTTRVLDDSGVLIPASSETQAVYFICAALKITAEESAEPSKFKSPWSKDAWRPNLPALQTVRFQADNKTVITQVIRPNNANEIEVRMGDKAYSVNRLQHGVNGQISFVLDNKPINANVVSTKRGFEIFLDGRHKLVFRFNPYAQSADSEAGGKLVAPMPGRIISVAVSLNQAVKKGQPIAVLEAMKMEHTLLAPADGIVSELNASPQRQVTEGQIIASIQSDQTV